MVSEVEGTVSRAWRDVSRAGGSGDARRVPVDDAASAPRPPPPPPPLGTVRVAPTAPAVPSPLGPRSAPLARPIATTTATAFTTMSPRRTGVAVGTSPKRMSVAAVGTSPPVATARGAPALARAGASDVVLTAQLGLDGSPRRVMLSPPDHRGRQASSASHTYTLVVDRVDQGTSTSPGPSRQEEWHDRGAAVGTHAGYYHQPVVVRESRPAARRGSVLESPQYEGREASLPRHNPSLGVGGSAVDSVIAPSPGACVPSAASADVGTSSIGGRSAVGSGSKLGRMSSGRRVWTAEETRRRFSATALGDAEEGGNGRRRDIVGRRHDVSRAPAEGDTAAVPRRRDGGAAVVLAVPTATEPREEGDNRRDAPLSVGNRPAPTDALSTAVEDVLRAGQDADVSPLTRARHHRIPVPGHLQPVVCSCLQPIPDLLALCRSPLQPALMATVVCVCTHPRARSTLMALCGTLRPSSAREPWTRRHCELLSSALWQR
jgi:hypothetical protein